MVKVFVAEDSVLVRSEIVLTTPWEELGCEVVGESGNGQAAYRMVLELKPHILITDIKMPDMDGLTMIRNLRGRLDMEYIVISGYSEFEYAISAIKLEVKNYLLKPIDDQELYRTVRQLVEKIDSRETKQPMKDNFEQGKERFISKSYSNFVIDAMKHIQKNYMNTITVKEIADILFISESHLSKIFKKETGMTVNEFIVETRIKRSMELLKSSEHRVYDVAESVGYKDYRYFSTVFKKYVGVYPKDYKRYVREEIE